MADEYDPKRHSIYRFEHAGITSERFLTRDECVAAAKVKVLAYPNEPAIIFMSTEVLTVENVTVRSVFPWYRLNDVVPLVSPPDTASELAPPLLDDTGLEII
jgi:hypothetical protein